MRPINVTLDSYTWELAKRKVNFSDWVRKQLHSEADCNSIPELQAELAQARKAIAKYRSMQQEIWDQEVKE